MEGHEVCHSEADISFGEPRFEYVCLQSHSKEIHSVQSSIHLLRKWNTVDGVNSNFQYSQDTD